MGELGLTPEQMEKRLSDILELCSSWNALILLDEADVFLEAREPAHLQRNAMVCVLLRLLEYQTGLLFLTTNRVRRLDPAVESRVTVSLRYEPLSREARGQVWRNLGMRILGQRVSEEMDYEALSVHELNGRQIKNVIRLAVALSMEMKMDRVDQRVMERTLALCHEGRMNMQLDDSWNE